GIRDTGARVRPGTNRTLRFDGRPSVTIPAGSTVTSDRVKLAVPALSDLVITLYLPTTTLPSTSHPQAATGYLSDTGDFTKDLDVLGQAAVKYVILLEGINDIGLGGPDVTADQVIAGYGELIDRAHASGLKIFGGTLTPAEGNPYPFYKPYDESKRQAINQFIRESGAFDAVLDFAAAVSDPA